MFDKYQNEDGSPKLFEVGDIVPVKTKFYIQSIKTVHSIGCQSPTEITITKDNKTFKLVEGIR